MKKLTIYIFGAILAIQPALGQETDTVTLTLSDVLTTALENNFQIQVSKNLAEISRNNFTPGNAGMLPAVSANGAINRSTQNTDQEFASGATQTRDGAKRKASNVGLNLAWTLFDGTQMFATYDRLENQALVSEYQLRQQIDNTISNVMILFYRVALEQERLELLESNVNFSKERVRIVDEKYQIGKESKLALLQAKVDLNTDRSSLMQQRELLTNQQLTLIQALGVEPFAFKLENEIIIDAKIDFEDISSKAYLNNPSLKALEHSKMVAENQFQEINRSRLPIVDFNAGYGYSNLESEAGFLLRNQTFDFSYGLTARVNLFNGFNTNRQIQNAMIQIENAELIQQETDQALETSLISTYASYANNLELSNLESENLDVAIENSEIALERFKLGVSDALELREAQINAVNAQVRFLQAQFNAKVAEIELKRLAGIVTEK